MNFLTIALLVISVISFAGEELTTSTFKDIEAKAMAYGKKYGEKNVLVALDIDNTLLTMPQSLGSDQWFNWQYKNCIGKKKLADYCVTDSFGKLLDTTGQIFAVSNMKPSDKHVINVVNNLQNKGFKVILLTSRGHEFRNATERAIKAHNMNFRRTAIGDKDGFGSAFLPYDIKNVKKAGITKDEAVVAKLKKARKVSYQNGLFMGAGQHKGIMLKTIMHKTKTKARAIVFADDHEKHTKRMQQIFGNKKNIDLTTFRYGAIDPQGKAFQESDKKDAISEYKNFMEMKNKVFK